MWRTFILHTAPELKRPAAEVQRAIARRTLWHVLRSRHFLAGLWAVALIFNMILWGAVFVPAWAAFLSGLRVTLPLLIVVHIVAAGLLVFMFPSVIRQSVRSQMNALGLPLCLRCGYDLRGVADRRCP
ncbi:MAG: hypothetical protein EA377_13185, partial [Phycisphaerales bacterium]